MKCDSFHLQCGPKELVLETLWAQRFASWQLIPNDEMSGSRVNEWNVL